MNPSMKAVIWQWAELDLVNKRPLSLFDLKVTLLLCHIT